MSTVRLSDFPVSIQRSFVEYDQALLQKSIDFLLDNVFDEDFEDILKKGKISLPIGTHRMRNGQEWEKTLEGWKLVKDDREETLKETEEHNSSKKPKKHKVDFSKISDEKLKQFAQETDEDRLAKFINHSGKSANGTSISKIVKEELSRKAAQKQQVKEIQKQPKLVEVKSNSDLKHNSIEMPVYLITKENVKRAKRLNVKGVGLLM